MNKQRFPLYFFISSIIVLILSIASVLGGTMFNLYQIGPTFIFIIFGLQLVALVTGMVIFVKWAKSFNS